MKRTKTTLTATFATAALSCLGSTAILRAAEDATPPAAAPSQTDPQVKAQAKNGIEQQRQEAQQQAEKTVDHDASAAIEETQKAIAAIASGKNDEAVAALERATGKINVLVARNPQTAFIPVHAAVDVIDVAPLDVKAIKVIAKAAEKAVDDRDYPASRLLLQALVSEIRVRIYNLPLATYPLAMQDAARLLDQKKPQEARAVLEAALNTIVVIDRVTPLPIAVAQEAINEAQAERDKDKHHSLELLAMARAELDRAKALGYAGKDPEYPALNQEVSEVEKQINGNQDSGSAFHRLKERVASFFRRQSSSAKGQETASR